MSRALLHLSILVLVGVSVSSCYSPQLMTDDDVYVVKPSALPVNESLNDETSYSSFKSRNSGTAVTSGFYADDPWLFGAASWHSSAWWGTGGYYNPRFYPYGYYSNYWGSTACLINPYICLNPFNMYDPYGAPYGFYPTACGPWYMGGMYGYPYMNSGYNYLPQNGYSFTLLTNHHSGPRGSISGFGTPNRPDGLVLKSAQLHQNNNINGLTDRALHSRLENQQVIGQSVFNRASRGISEKNLRHAEPLKPVANRGIQTPGLRTNPPGSPAFFEHNAPRPPARNNGSLRPDGGAVRGGSVKPSGSGRPAGSGSPVRRN